MSKNRKTYLQITKMPPKSNSTAIMQFFSIPKQFQQNTKPSLTHYSSSDSLQLQLNHVPLNKLYIQPIQVYAQKNELRKIKKSLIPSQVNCFSGYSREGNNLQSQKQNLIEYNNLIKNIKSTRLRRGQCNQIVCKVKQNWIKFFNQIDIVLFHDLKKIQLQIIIINQIKKDSERSFGCQQHSIHNQHQKIKQLQNIIQAYAKYDKQASYVQGMNLIIRPILDHTKQQIITFSIFKYLMQSCKLRNLYIKNFEYLNHHCIKIYSHLKLINNELYQYLKNLHIEPITFLSSWLLSLFGNLIDFQYMHLIINKFIEDGYSFLYRFSITYLIYLKQDIFDAGQSCLSILGSSYSRMKNTNWLQIILASNMIILNQ